MSESVITPQEQSGCRSDTRTDTGHGGGHGPYKALYHYCYRRVKRNCFLQTVHCGFATMNPWAVEKLPLLARRPWPPLRDANQLMTDVGSADAYRILLLYSLVVRTWSFDFHTGIIINRRYDCCQCVFIAQTFLALKRIWFKQICLTKWCWDVIHNYTLAPLWFLCCICHLHSMSTSRIRCNVSPTW